MTMPDYLDPDSSGRNVLGVSGDSDADGLVDALECPDGIICPDSDGDQIPNYTDGNSDNDSTPDVDEIGPDPLNPTDTDGDGIPDYLEPDDQDTDGDGISNQEDDDDDNDFVMTNDELGAGGAFFPQDRDSDGTPDYLQADFSSLAVTVGVDGGAGALSRSQLILFC